MNADLSVGGVLHGVACKRGTQQIAAVRKRQEIGRGVRLCVDQAGRRVPDPSINLLEVFANESYEAFVAGLQEDDAWPQSEHAPTAPAEPTQAGLPTGLARRGANHPAGGSDARRV